LWRPVGVTIKFKRQGMGAVPFDSGGFHIATTRAWEPGLLVSAAAAS